MLLSVWFTSFFFSDHCATITGVQWHLEFKRVNHGLLQSKRLLAYKVAQGIVHVTSCRNPCWKGDWKCFIFLLFLYVQFVLVQQVREAERTTGGCSSEGIHRDHQNCSRANTCTRIKSTSGKPSFCLPLHSVFGCWFICKWLLFFRLMSYIEHKRPWF